ncbi:LOW QUALITY PROTEIN: hypothetical protein TorRG33x02_075700 [Trema orientale]|uniref:Uncharacterized protein n=1 Tax=Trema orientale TaxID=63057 RepID=A0A2P5FFN0_TREOI|nr:LOW QUALITY PROTEIN: hypothetical protein TorRG33x02_075700 [Trema orientale]
MEVAAELFEYRFIDQSVAGTTGTNVTYWIPPSSRLLKLNVNATIQV